MTTNDYATNMHVDANNHGPSYIIGFGDYAGGDLWIYGEEGDVFNKVPCPVPRYSHLKLGTKVPGKVWDCHNKWVVFDDTMPHMTTPLVVKQYAIVYFTPHLYKAAQRRVHADLRV